MRLPMSANEYACPRCLGVTKENMCVDCEVERQTGVRTSPHEVVCEACFPSVVQMRLLAKVVNGD